MEHIESFKHSIIHEGSIIEYSRIKSKNKLIHEHDFVTTRLKGANQIAICCVTCDDCYCDVSGKLFA